MTVLFGCSHAEHNQRDEIVETRKGKRHEWWCGLCGAVFNSVAVTNEENIPA